VSILCERWHRVLWAALLGLHAHAQTAGTNWPGAPVLGLVSNSEKTEVRPIQGVPGASTVGDVLPLPAGLGRVYLAPLQQWALVEPRREQTLGLLPLTGPQPGVVTAVYGAMPRPDLVSYSSNGQNAALVSRRSGTLQVLSHLPGTPQVTMQSDISQLGVVAVAVSDDGLLAAVLTESGGVYLAPPGGSCVLIFRAGSPAGFTFLLNQEALAVADGAAGTITVIQGLNSQPGADSVIAGPNLSGDSLFLQPSSDGKALILSANGGQTAYRIDLLDQRVNVLAAPARFSMLERLNGDMFLFSADAGKAAWLLLADGGDLRVGFAQFTGKPAVRKPVSSLWVDEDR